MAFPLKYVAVKGLEQARPVRNPDRYVRAFSRRTGKCAVPCPVLFSRQRSEGCNVVGMVDGVVGNDGIVEVRRFPSRHAPMTEGTELGLQTYMWLTKKERAFLVRVFEEGESELYGSEDPNVGEWDYVCVKRRNVNLNDFCDL